MAGLYQSLRPNNNNPPFFTPNSTPLIQPYNHHFLYKLLLFLTILPLLLAFFSFFLQWRGGPIDPVSRWSFDHPEFPEMHNSPVIKSEKCKESLLGQSNSPVFPYFKGWSFGYNATNLGPKACITSSTSAGLEQVLPWIFYHKVIGITDFFLFVEGKASSPSVSNVLESIPGVRVIPRTKQLEEEQAKSRIWNETWLANFFFKPCNNELFVKQTLNMEMAIHMAREADMEWIFHLDTDELLHPAGTREYSVRELLMEVPQDVDMIVFPNYESAVERNDIKEPFSEVSMFKKNYDHLPRETYFGNYKEASRGNPNYFLTYGNGKAAARIKNNLRPNGAHRWHNYVKFPNEVKMEEAAVLHYTYSKYSDLTSRRDRCGCKPTKEDVKRCFMLEFDRSAFIIASTATEEEMLQWYNEHVVWHDETLKHKFLKFGILLRIYAPMNIIQGLRESGVFASVIASAQAASSNSNNESSENIEGRKLISKNIGLEDPSVTRRRVLEHNVVHDHIQAIPPLSPPSIDEFSEVN